MCGHPEELAGHGAEVPRVSASSGARSSWSVWLIDSLHCWREQRVHAVTSLPVGRGETPVPQRSGAGTGLLGLAYRVEERPLCF